MCFDIRSWISLQSLNRPWRGGALTRDFRHLGMNVCLQPGFGNLGIGGDVFRAFAHIYNLRLSDHAVRLPHLQHATNMRQIITVTNRPLTPFHSYNSPDFAHKAAHDDADRKLQDRHLKLQISQSRISSLLHDGPSKNVTPFEIQYLNL